MSSSARSVWDFPKFIAYPGANTQYGKAAALLALRVLLEINIQVAHRVFDFNQIGWYAHLHGPLTHCLLSCWSHLPEFTGCKQHMTFAEQVDAADRYEAGPDEDMRKEEAEDSLGWQPAVDLSDKDGTAADAAEQS